MSGLTGKRIVVTRAPHQADDLIDAIQGLGGISVRYPCIDIAPPTDLSSLDYALENVRDFDWVLFTSRNTVHMIAERIEALNLRLDWEDVKIGAVGTKTSETILDLLGAKTDFVPEQHTGSDLARNLPIYPYEKVLLPQSSLADDDIYTILLGERQTDVTLVTAYRTIIGQGGDDVPKFLQNKQIDAITFTSPSTVANFIARIAPKTAWDIPAVCIGTTTAKVARDSGFQMVHTPSEHTIDHLLELLDNLFTEASHDQI